MSWKSQIQVRDLEDDQRLEMICLKCGRLVYIKKADICKKEGYEQIYLDEVERVHDAAVKDIMEDSVWLWSALRN